MAKTTFLTFISSLCCFLGVFHLQITHAQIVIGKPVLEFTQACANDTFNSFTTSFVFSPESGVETSNQFLIELSDATGSFNTATTVFTSNPGAITASPANVSFSLPMFTAGEEYKIRIKSTHPEAVSASSNSFAAYYKIQDSPFTINDLTATAVFCPGGSYLLSIDNPGTGDNDSPLQYPSLTFNWMKETGPTTSVIIGQGPTLAVSEAGVYFAETNYGSCTSDSFSNRVTVSEATSEESADATIVSSLGNPFCSQEGPTTLQTITGNSYTWFKNGTIIPGATSQTYETESSGLYEVIVSFGSCEASGSIDLNTGDFTAEINVPETNLLESGETIDVLVTTNAIAPEFKWFLNEEEISGALENSFTVTEFGLYRIEITQTDGCVFTKELSFQVDEFTDPFPNVDKIPNIISPNGDGINDTWIIPIEYTSGTNSNVTILKRNGEDVFSTNDYVNNWPEDPLPFSDVNQVFYYIITPPDKDPIKGSITVLK
ncbi:T9SS type B sorting domain-containing protein [Cochleicola gelatinilyticus]|uniref:Ig-like domain-containing protein n=1 Tax=Cochleicola gelatinilyticus TaxID=1763537 RepID=A0A167GXM1_9FLAO|nr:gliding motility-associated C-terminal domain-containing protein [Cochleicola gelatinilyticus]OAB78012.1 hypothetical protein ULVI_11035 [Cochleicola gelatinilyticus]